MAGNLHDSDEPVHLIEREGSGDLVLIYATEKGANVELRYEGEGLWMTQAQMASLFGRDVSVISRHIANILEERELLEDSNLQFLQIAHSTKPVAIYSLDMVISVGYRVSSAQATLFRRWATAVLVQFATQGFVIDADRLKNPAEHDRLRELREIIRDIRASEANLYAELRRICALCQDYDSTSPAATVFYREMQAKLFYAVTNQTPAEILQKRADATADNMGLQTWPKANIRKSDAIVSKNYLGQGEIKELNRLTSLLLDIFEDQLDIGRLVTMADARQQLDGSLAHMGRLVLRDGGHVRRDQAEAKAIREYERFDAERKAVRQAAVDQELSRLKDVDRSLPQAPRKRRD